MDLQRPSEVSPEHRAGSNAWVMPDLAKKYFKNQFSLFGVKTCIIFNIIIYRLKLATGAGAVEQQ